MTKVYNKRMVEGITVPIIIHNSSYFYIDMPVYEDGSMDCWKRISLSELSEEIESGWLVTEIPVGEHINIHGLGNYKILEANWTYTKESFIEYINKIVKKMNSEMVGLFEKTKEQSEKWGKYRVSWGATGMPYKIKGDFGYNIQDGNSTSILFRKKDMWELTSVIAYEDETFSIDSIPDNFFTLDEIKDMFKSDKLSSDPEGAITISIPELGTIKGQADYSVYTSEKLKEVEDMLSRICKKPTLHEKCREAYFLYLEYPCDRNKEELRVSYEAIPEHERMYLGDMDSKDYDYRRILYTDEKREV